MSFAGRVKQRQKTCLPTVPISTVGQVVSGGPSKVQLLFYEAPRIDYPAYVAAKSEWRAAHLNATNEEDDQAMLAIAFEYGV